MAMPRLAGGTLFIFVPSMTTSPDVASSSPAMTRSRVYFPHPDGPTKTTNSPFSTSRSMFFRTSTLPKILQTLVRVMASLLQCDRSAGADAFVGSEADAQRLERILHVPRQIDIFGNGL